MTITVSNYDLGPGIDDNYVNSTLTAEASVLSTKLKPVGSLTRKVVVDSIFQQPATFDPQKPEDQQKLAEHEVRAKKERPEDQKVVPLGTSRKSKGPPMFPETLEKAMKATVNHMSRATLNTRLEMENGWGPAYIGVLWKAYDYIKRKSDKTLFNLNDEEARNFRAMVTRWKGETAPLIQA